MAESTALAVIVSNGNDSRRLDLQWTYSGSWGVNVRPATDNDWESGTQRVDEFQRSLGYWNALRLVTWLSGGSPGP